VEAKRRVYGEMKHLDRVGDCRTHYRVHHKTCGRLDRRDSLGT
jgi:hypothetical protein